MISKRNVALFMCMIMLMSICMLSNVHAQGNGYYAPKGSNTSWILQKDNADAFLLYDEDTIFYGYVMDSDINSDIIDVSLRTNRNIMTTDPHSEIIIDYDEMTCHPFYETRLNLQWTPNGYVTTVEIPETVLGATRNVTTLEILNKDGTGRDWLLKYDSATGILIQWKIIWEGKETLLAIRSTDAWVTISPFLQNLWWILILVSVASISIVLLILWLRRNARNENTIANNASPISSVVFQNEIDDRYIPDI